VRGVDSRRDFVLASAAVTARAHLAELFDAGRRLARAALDAVVPPTCPACREQVATPHALCASCWARLSWIDRPWCESCGLPFDYATGLSGAPVCAACLAREPVCAKSRAALRYDPGSRGLVLAFKHADRTQNAPAFAAWMARAGADALVGADLLIPVPLHWTRLVRRRFNQAALLARALSKRTGIPFAPDLLARVRMTRTQGDLTRAQRRTNVRGAFKARPRAAAGLRGKTVVLIDAVMTTGATFEACARALRRAGAKEVRALALARVVRPGEGTP
jgi:ComF family protein